MPPLFRIFYTSYNVTYVIYSKEGINMKNLDSLAIITVGQAVKDYESAYQRKDMKALEELGDWFSGEGFKSLGLKSDGAEILSLIQNKLKLNDEKI